MEVGTIKVVAVVLLTFWGGVASEGTGSFSNL